MRFRKNHSYYARKSAGRSILPVRGKENPQAGAEADADGEGESETEGDEPQGDEQPAAKTFTQEEVNAILAKEKEKARRAKEREQKEAEQAELEKNQEFQKLADDLKQEVADLTAEKERLEAEVESQRQVAARYEAVLQKYAKEAKKGLDKGVQALLEKLPLDEQLAWIAENKPAQGAGTPPTPRGNNAGATQEEIEKRRRETSRAYRGFF